MDCPVIAIPGQYATWAIFTDAHEDKESNLADSIKI